MPGFFKFLKGYNQYETDMSTWLSAGVQPPSEEELSKVYCNYTQNFRHFTDLHTLIFNHLTRPQSISKFLRAVALMIFTLQKLAPLRHQGVCVPLDQLDLEDGAPIPPASLFFNIRLALVEAKPVFVGIQWWGQKIEEHGLVEKVQQQKQTTTPKSKPPPKIKQAPGGPKNPNVLVFDYDDDDDIESGKKSSGSDQHLFGAGLDDSSRLSSGGRSSLESGGFAPTSSDTITAHTDSNPSTAPLSDPLKAGSDGGSTLTVDEVVRPPNACIIGMHEAWTKHNISTRALVQQLLDLIESFSLVHTTHPTSEAAVPYDDGDQLPVALPRGPPPKIKSAGIVTQTPAPDQPFGHYQDNWDNKNDQPPAYDVIL